MAAVVASAITPAAAQADPTPFGNACTLQNSIRFCPATELSQRPTSFDGTPIDADVTLPATGTGPWPTVVMIHGYGGSKTSYESNSAPTENGMNNVSYAARGYAVVNVSERGFGRSCGHDTATRTAGCDHGYVHLMDTRYEAHDVQYLLGTLVDQGIADPANLGALGASYGGGASLELAYLKNRVRNLDGTYSPWKSTAGTSLSLKAAWPQIPWSNLSSALVPNGRYLDFDSTTAGLSTSPAGVAISTYISSLYGGGLSSGWYTGAGVDPEADLTTWRAEINAGEPFSSSALTDLNKISNYHSAFTVTGATPAALLIENGWTDDLFPPAEALRVYQSQRAAGNGNVRLLFDDIGHPRSQNPSDAAANSRLTGRQFLDAQLKGIAGGPAAGSATAMGMGCDGSGVSGGPWTASTWEALHPGAVSFKTTKSQTLSSTGGLAATGNALDPMFGTAGACGELADATEPKVATYKFTSKGFTMLGLPTVQATIKTTGKYGEIASRLWDVTGGKRRMITRGVYRLLDNQSGTVTFQLHGNAYNFAAGHTVKLELLASDSPYYQKSKGTFNVKISKLTLELPTRDTKNASKGIGSPVIGKFKR